MSAAAQPVWQTIDTAPQPEEGCAYSRTFVGVYKSNPDHPFACQSHDGKVYNIEATDMCGDYLEVADYSDLMWTEMPRYRAL